MSELRVSMSEVPSNFTDATRASKMEFVKQLLENLFAEDDDQENTDSDSATETEDSEMAAEQDANTETNTEIV
jgi:hypothetical protein